MWKVGRAKKKPIHLTDNPDTKFNTRYKVNLMENFSPNKWNATRGKVYKLNFGYCYHFQQNKYLYNIKLLCNIVWMLASK